MEGLRRDRVPDTSFYLYACGASGKFKFMIFPMVYETKQQSVFFEARFLCPDLAVGALLSKSSRNVYWELRNTSV